MHFHLAPAQLMTTETKPETTHARTQQEEVRMHSPLLGEYPAADTKWTVLHAGIKGPGHVRSNCFTKTVRKDRQLAEQLTYVHTDARAGQQYSTEHIRLGTHQPISEQAFADGNEGDLGAIVGHWRRRRRNWVQIWRRAAGQAQTCTHPASRQRRHTWL